MGDQVPTPWEERLSSPRPPTAGWRIVKRDQGCWAAFCGPKVRQPSVVLGLTSPAFQAREWEEQGRSDRAGLSQDRKGVAEIGGFLRKNNPDPQTRTREEKAH